MRDNECITIFLCNYKNKTREFIIYIQYTKLNDNKIIHHRLLLDNTVVVSHKRIMTT